MRIVKKIFIVLVIIIVAITILPWIVFPISNNIKLYKFSKQLYNCKLPNNTELIDKDSVYGKLNGNGNGLDFATVIVLKSELDNQNIENYYKSRDFHTIEEKDNPPTIEVGVISDGKIDSKLLEHKSFILGEDSKKDDYYYVIIYDGGYASYFDINGN